MYSHSLFKLNGMRKILLLAAALTTLFAASSCQKDKAANAPSDAMSSARIANTAKAKPIIIFGPDKYRIYDHPSAECYFTGGNCLDDIVIVAPRVSQLMSTIRDGGNYPIFVRQNMEELSASLPEDYLQGVIASKYTLAIDDNLTTKMQYLKFMSGSDIALVIPIKP